jgi:hypothetical protein
VEEHKSPLKNIQELFLSIYRLGDKAESYM